MKNKFFNVKDIITAECNLEPIKCAFCGSKEVTYSQTIKDAYCAECGLWQISDNKPSKKEVK